MTIVFSCCQPSLVVSYDTVQAIHSVWVLRKVTCDVRDLTHTRKCTNTNTAACTLFRLPLKERSSVLRCPVDPVGTPLRLMASGFLTSHLRNMSNLDSPCGVGAHGLGSGTGPRFVIHCFFFLIYCERISLADISVFGPFWSNKSNVTIFWIYLV